MEAARPLIQGSPSPCHSGPMENPLSMYAIIGQGREGGAAFSRAWENVAPSLTCSAAPHAELSECELSVQVCPRTSQTPQVKEAVFPSCTLSFKGTERRTLQRLLHLAQL